MWKCQRYLTERWLVEAIQNVAELTPDSVFVMIVETQVEIKQTLFPISVS